MADETIRWIDSEFSIHEDLIGLVHVEKKIKVDATSISTAIKDVLVCCSSQCRGQGYDGCSVMVGHITGVATQLRQVEPAAHQVHCSLNLCLQDAAKLCTIVRECLGLVREMLQLILYSPKRSLVFDKMPKGILT